MVQVKDLTERGYFVMAAITEREGIMMAQCHADEKTEFEIQEHFDRYYKVFSENEDTGVIVHAAREQMSDTEFVEMLANNDYVAPFEALALEGYLTKLNSKWVLSLEKYWKGDSEGWEVRC